MMRQTQYVPECPNCEHAPECPHYDALGRVPANVDCPKAPFVFDGRCVLCERKGHVDRQGFCQECRECRE